MPTISTCPHCSRMVTIPEGLDATTLVRCPLCSAEYPLSDAMELAPPELIPVQSSEQAILLPTTAPIEGADQQEAGIIPLDLTIAKPIPIQSSKKTPPATAIHKPVAGLINEPFFSADEAEAGDAGTRPDMTDDTATIDAPPLVSSVILRYGRTLQGEPGPEANFSIEETADTSESPLDDEVFSLIAKHKEETEKEFSNQSEPITLRNRSQRKSKSVLRIFFEIVSGGIVGITIGYIALAWIMGSRFDLPKPPSVLKPVLQFVLPERVWQEKQPPQKKSQEIIK